MGVFLYLRASLDLLDSRITLAPMTLKPFWPDRCGHDRPRDRFLGRFEITGRSETGRYDVCVYQDNALDAPVPDMHVCIRYGDTAPEYISPGPVAAFLERAAYVGRVYTLAAELVREWQQTHE